MVFKTQSKPLFSDVRFEQVLVGIEKYSDHLVTHGHPDGQLRRLQSGADVVGRSPHGIAVPDQETEVTPLLDPNAIVSLNGGVCVCVCVFVCVCVCECVRVCVFVCVYA